MSTFFYTVKYKKKESVKSIYYNTYYKYKFSILTKNLTI